MKNEKKQSIDLETAQNLILKKCRVLSAEKVSLSKSLKRFPAALLVALESLPGYDQSLRDGYAISREQQGGKNCYEIIDEVAAGDIRKLLLGENQAIRIMTGGLIPENALAVVPRELCSVNGETVSVKTVFLEPQRDFIHRKGCELAEGEVIVPEGSAIEVEQLILLAGVGYDSVPLVRKPRISFFCTGSELISGGEEKLAGEKYSANSHLLHGLIEHAGAKVQVQGTVKDDPEAVMEALTAMSESGSDIIVSTGGMGPGKFDLVEDAFLRAGGRVIYHSLHLRPGKSTLFGMLGRSLFFGMPGPPPAVHLLFNELIRPAILALQGAKNCRPREVEAYLTENLYFPKRGLPRLKSGFLSFAEGRCLVRPSTTIGGSNCYIYCSESARELKNGDRVTVHMIDSLPYID